MYFMRMSRLMLATKTREVKAVTDVVHIVVL